MGTIYLDRANIFNILYLVKERIRQANTNFTDSNQDDRGSSLYRIRDKDVHAGDALSRYL